MTHPPSQHEPAAPPCHHANDPELQLFERQLRRFGENGNCAYERALGQLYRRLCEQRRQQLDALRRAGM